MIVMTPLSSAVTAAGASRSGMIARSPCPAATLWRMTIPLSPAAPKKATPSSSVATLGGVAGTAGGKSAACSVPCGAPGMRSSYDFSQYHFDPSRAIDQCDTSLAITCRLLASPNFCAFKVSTPPAVGRADQAIQSPAGDKAIWNLVTFDSASSLTITVSILESVADPSPIAPAKMSALACPGTVD